MNLRKSFKSCFVRSNFDLEIKENNLKGLIFGLSNKTYLIISVSFSCSEISFKYSASLNCVYRVSILLVILQINEKNFIF